MIDYLALLNEIEGLYRADKRPWIIGFSGGKDSTVAILEALKQYPKDEIILCWQDTGAGLPELLR